MDSVQGCALVASPYLNDPNFLRSVVYILQHDEEGALGLLLNRETHRTIGELLTQLGESQVHNAEKVFWGGPVDGPLMLLQAVAGSCASSIYAASDQERILSICGAPHVPGKDQEPYRLFDGYSGWGAGQLESELRAGGWLLWEINPEQVFSDPDQIWETAVKAIGREILAGGIDPSKMPEDPAFN